MPNMNHKPPHESGKAKNAKLALINLAKYCKKYWWAMIVAMVCAIGSTVLAVLGPDKLSEIIDVITAGISMDGINIDMNAVVEIGLILVAMYGSSMVLNYAQGFLMSTVSCRVTQKMRSDISGKINKVPLKYFDTHNFGDTLSRVTNDVDTIAQSLNMSVGALVSSTATIIGCIIMMFVTQWIMAIAAIVSSLVGFALMGVVMVKSQKHFNARQQNLAVVNSHVEEYYAGQNIVRAYNAESDAKEVFVAGNDNLRKSTFKAEFLASLMMPMMNFVGNLGYVVVCIVGAALAFSNKISFSVVVAFMIYVRLFTSPLSQIAQGMTGIQSAAAAGERVFEFLGETELSDESAVSTELTNVKGDIVFDGINFGYNPDKIIINNFSASVKAGQKIAIVGPTGAGKTTIVNLLMRFYELNSGRITVDGVDITDITRKNVHDIFGMVLQDTWLFEGSLRDNLTYGKDISDETLQKICDEVGLSHFVNTLSQGLDTPLNDTVTISAGQKQLITIARAMVENAPMLILDEATSSVDTRTEMQIQIAMDKLTEGRTSFVIAHRLSTIRDADMIIYMKDGDIKETGTHEELLSKNGLYAELYNSQFMTA